MRWQTILLVLALGACDRPSVSFVAGSVREVTIDDSRFRVFMHPGGSQVEAHRVSIEALPSLVDTLEKAHRAIETATSCQVVPGSLRGDQAIVLADVYCAFP